MSFSRNQLIIIGGVGLVLVLGVLVLAGVVPGLKKDPGKILEGDLLFWGIEDQEVFHESISNFEKIYPRVRITYEQIDKVNYEAVLVDALAAGRGPDIFEFHNTWLPKHYNKLSSFSDTILPLSTFRNLFPKVVEQDFAPDGVIFALPLYIDTLALYYNQDLFDNEGIVAPPKDWNAFVSFVSRLRKLNSGGQLLRAAAALGGTERSVDRATDIILNIMLQTGVEMTDPDFNGATFGSSLGQEAFNFYLRFSNPKDSAFTWTETFGNSRDAFSEGKAAMTINYLSFKNYIKNKNPFLRFGIAKMPEPQGSSQSVNFANYWGLSISNQTKFNDAAAQFVLNITTNEEESESYVKRTNRSPALRSLIERYLNNSDLGIFAKQALTARSWPQIDNVKIADIFSRAIFDVLSGKLNSASALSRAENEATALMKARIR